MQECFVILCLKGNLFHRFHIIGDKMAFLVNWHDYNKWLQPVTMYQKLHE